MTAEEIVSATGFPVERVQAEIKTRMRTGKLLYLDGRGYFDRVRYELLKRQVGGRYEKDLLKRCLQVGGEQQTKSGFGWTPILMMRLFERMLGELCKEGKLTRTEKGYRVPNFVVKLPSHAKSSWSEWSNLPGSRAMGPFSAEHSGSVTGKGSRTETWKRCSNHLHAQKKLVRLNDGRFITVEALEEIKEKVKALILRKGSLTLHDSWEILGYGRSRAIAIFEYLDTTVGLTCRVGDVRVLRSEDRLRVPCGHV